MKQNHHFLLGCFLLALMCLSCNNKQNEKREMVKLLSAISENDNAWNNLNADKIAAMFAENGTALNNNLEMLRGREAIKRYLEAMQKPEKFEVKRDKVEVTLKGNMAYEIVNQTLSLKYQDKEPQTVLNKYIHVWEKQKDGSWKVLIDMNNMRKPSGE
jgi:uncharacterized protein (TIGR02246 family)